MRVLFITSTRIGDATLSTGVLSHIIDKYPGASITIACGPGPSDLFRSVPGLDRLLVMNKKKYNGHWLNILKECYGQKWDLIVDLRNSLVSRLLRAKARAYCSQKTANTHKVIENASALHVSPPPPPRIWLDKSTIAIAEKVIGNGEQPILALGPSANWPAKQWSGYNFLKLAHKLTADSGPLANARILIVADENEKSQIAPLLNSLPPAQLINAVGLRLSIVAACIKKCRLFIGNDSGLAHISAAAGTPTLGLFGPGYEKIYSPWGKHTATIRADKSTQELLARLPYPGAPYPNLMGDLWVDRVFDSAVELLLRTA